MFSWLLAAIGVAVVIVVVLSLAGAIYPAWKAGRMLPVEAMRRT
jgi:ABC-type antimicrobial peptide transport system permease subunit